MSEITMDFPEAEDSVDQINDIADRAMAMVDRMRDRAFRPEQHKELRFRFGIQEAAKLINSSTARIRAAEEDGRLPSPDVSDTNRRVGYTIEELYNMRKVLNELPWRPEGSEPIILAMQNFKGGVGKSTTSVHLSHYLAIRGYRVLVIDVDSQATTTTMFGLDPHLVVDREETLYPFLSIDQTQKNLNYAVQPTAWPNIDLIPSAQSLYEVEYELSSADEQGNSFLSTRLRQLSDGVREIAQNYDVVIMDPPPALGTISIAVMQAANAILVPLAATVPDYCSTAQFSSMLGEVAEDLKNAGIRPKYKFIRFLISKFSARDTSQMLLRDNALSKGFGENLLPVPILESAEISHAFVRWSSVYELERAVGASKTHKRCRENLDEVFEHVEKLFIEQWQRDQARGSK